MEKQKRTGILCASDTELEPFLRRIPSPQIAEKATLTASVAHVCHVNRVPFLSVRTITDTAEHMGIENFEQNCETASERSAQIVTGILAQ